MPSLSHGHEREGLVWRTLCESHELALLSKAHMFEFYVKTETDLRTDQNS